MALTAKQQRVLNKIRADMTSIASGTMGQSITITSKTRSYDADGKYTGATSSTATKNAVICYITQEQDELVTAGKAKVGDAKLYVEYDSTVDEEDFITDQAGDEWRIIEIFNKPEVFGEYTEIHAIIRRSHSR